MVGRKRRHDCLAADITCCRMEASSELGKRSLVGQVLTPAVAIGAHSRLTPRSPVTPPESIPAISGRANPSAHADGSLSTPIPADAPRAGAGPDSGGCNRDVETRLVGRGADPANRPNARNNPSGRCPDLRARSGIPQRGGYIGTMSRRWSLNDYRKRSLTVIAVAAAAAAAMLLTGYPGRGCVPDQTQFRPFSAVISDERAVVRLYGAPIPYLRSIAIHPWFVVKPAHSTDMHRWEVWQRAGGPYGHVRRNLLDPISNVGGGETFVIAELTGTKAEAVIDFIVHESPTYAWRTVYHYVPGPNSNTYAQWIINNTGWNVQLPPTAIGKSVALR